MRHVLSLSGGKDSAAMAVLLKKEREGLEYVFCDTGEELPETYEYLSRLELVLGRPITRLRSPYSFSDWLSIKGGYLPSPRARWCTEYLKLRPFEEYVGSSEVTSYIAIRADEQGRKGYTSTKPNIQPAYPLRRMGIGLSDVRRILESSGLGLPGYYEWRSRSGCYFCFFQRGIEWLGLLERHPHLYWKAASFEQGHEFTWRDGESLVEVASPDRIKQIRDEYRKRLQPQRSERLIDILSHDAITHSTCPILRL